MFKDYIQDRKDLKAFCKGIQEASKKIQEGVKTNGVVLDKAFSAPLPVDNG